MVGVNRSSAIDLGFGGVMFVASGPGRFAGFDHGPGPLRHRVPDERREVLPS
jgi:hypothetical protein